jgi:ribosomal protein L40E
VAQFTTGFDVTDVEAIILNRPTNSLSLFLQMVGRGGRSTTKIYKDSFILIDGGNNIERHNEWSDPTRDWKKIFFGGLDKEKEKAKKIELDNLQICENDECGAYFPKAIDVCPECNTEVLRKKREINKTESDLITEPIKKIPPPNAEKIYLYTLSQNEDLNFAWRILINKIFDLFIYYRVSKEKYQSALNSGELDKKIKKMVTQCYFVLKSKNDLNSGVERTIQYLVNKVKIKLENKYGK